MPIGGYYFIYNNAPPVMVVAGTKKTSRCRRKIDIELPDLEEETKEQAESEQTSIDTTKHHSRFWYSSLCQVFNLSDSIS